MKIQKCLVCTILASFGLGVQAHEPDVRPEITTPQTSKIDEGATIDEANAKGDDEIKNEVLSIGLEARGDYQYSTIDGDKNQAMTGFGGSYINLIIHGNLSSKFSYHYRQRFSKATLSNFFESTDYLYVDFTPNPRWEISAGKQIIGIGGYEYDYAPIDVYQYTEFCNGITCYGWGASVAYKFKGGNDKLVAQAAQSIVNLPGKDLYGYNLVWYGNHGKYSSIWSVNMHEYAPGKYINYVALGNRVDFCDKAYFFIDYTNRYCSGFNTSFFKDFTVNGEIHYRPIPELKLFGKYSYDHNEANGGDHLLHPGTKMQTAGLGVEAFPIKGDRSLRLHAAYYYSWGTNTNPDGWFKNKQGNLYLGLTWRADLLRLARKK